MGMQGAFGFMKRAVIDLAVFSAVVSVLLLIIPLYLLQVYDRVLPASSADTLVFLTIIAMAGLLVLGIVDEVRARYAGRIALRIDRELGAAAFRIAVSSPGAATGMEPALRDLAAVRGFLSNRAAFTLFDLPFAPLFLIVLYFVHPLLSLVTLAGILVLFLIAWLNRAATQTGAREAGDAAVAANAVAQVAARNIESIRALGMMGAMTQLWGRRFAQSARIGDAVARVNSRYGGISRTVRLGLQIVTLGLGAWLVLSKEMTAGMIFAASIISGRALQPIDQVINGWRQIADTGQAWKRLSGLAQRLALAREASRTDLPAPSGAVSVDNLVYFPPGSDPGALPLIKRLTFAIAAGETVAIVGPSRAGKSTLARLLVGAIEPKSGSVRMDGADIKAWDPEALGVHVGYMAQEVELFAGTVGENIARFAADPAAGDDAVKAAMAAQSHELIMALPRAYDTIVGPGAHRLSGGESQRIALARAFFRNPRLIILDEPNAHLDQEGEAALEKAVAAARSRGATVIIVTHRPSIASKCDRIMVLREGQIEKFAPAAEVLRSLAEAGVTRGAAPAAPQNAPNPGARMAQPYVLRPVPGPGDRKT